MALDESRESGSLHVVRGSMTLPTDTFIILPISKMGAEHVIHHPPTLTLLVPSSLPLGTLLFFHLNGSLWDDLALSYEMLCAVYVRAYVFV